MSATAETAHRWALLVCGLCLLAVLLLGVGLRAVARAEAERAANPAPSVPVLAAGEVMVIPQPGDGHDGEHAALITDRSAAVLERGKALFADNCVRCHGADGESNPAKLSPPPRNLRRDGFFAPHGGGPYGVFLTISQGWPNGRMPSFANLDLASRYALAHYVREVLAKPRQPQHYRAWDDPAQIAKQ